MKLEKAVLLIILALITGIAVSFVTIMLNPAIIGRNTAEETIDSVKVSAPQNEVSLIELAVDVMSLLKQEDYSKLFGIVHPVKGVLFAPSTTVEKEKNMVFMPAEVKAFSSDASKYVWGMSSYSGNSIELTPAEYVKRYITDDDYLGASTVGINRTIGTGALSDNIQQVFPSSEYVDFCIFDSENNVKWHSVKLVFEMYEGSHRLVAVIRSDWSI